MERPSPGTLNPIPSPPDPEVVVSPSLCPFECWEATDEVTEVVRVTEALAEPFVDLVLLFELLD